MALYKGRFGTPYTLDSELGHGGEGSVYTVLGNAQIVAKIYHPKKFIPTAECSDPRRYMEEKILTMLDQPVNPYVGQVLSVAWPQDVLYDKYGNFAGFTMPIVLSRKHIFTACRPRERVQLFPSYTWKTAVIIAYNLALAVQLMHASGAIVGDLNANNIMLNQRGQVTLIDTDSFNITNKKNGTVYKCSVGVPEMLAPELQGKNLSRSTSRFTEATDNFALAIHIFNLLMNNCHPFGCTDMNKSKSSSGNNPIMKNITKGFCPYVNGGGSVDTASAAPDFSMLPPEIQALFKRAFSYTAHTAVQPTIINARPSAAEWRDALRKIIERPLKTCPLDSSHIYPEHNYACPWCAVTHKQIAGSAPVHPASPPKSVPPKKNTALPPSVPRKPSSFLRRNAVPLWIVYILVGCMAVIPLSLLLTPYVSSWLEISIPIEVSYIVFLIIAVASGSVLSFLVQKKYQKAIIAWPWMLLALTMPIAMVIVAGLLLLAIGLAVLAVSLVVSVITIICLCNIFGGG